MWLQGFEVAILLGISTAYPAKLLRTPKIYNALITSKEKILPSEAYPGTTGPIFQPIGLSPFHPTLVYPPEVIVDGPKPEDLNVREGDTVKLPYDPANPSKVTHPLTFFPRYRVYYPHQPHLVVQHPFLYYQVPNSVQPRRSELSRPTVDAQLENEERRDLHLQTSGMRSSQKANGDGTRQSGQVQVEDVAAPSLREYVKNNRPADPNIPDIPPPPPPIRYRDPDHEKV